MSNSSSPWSQQTPKKATDHALKEKHFKHLLNNEQYMCKPRTTCMASKVLQDVYMYE